MSAAKKIRSLRLSGFQCKSRVSHESLNRPSKMMARRCSPSSTLPPSIGTTCAHEPDRECVRHGASSSRADEGIACRPAHGLQARLHRRESVRKSDTATVVRLPWFCSPTRRPPAPKCTLPSPAPARTLSSPPPGRLNQVRRSVSRGAPARCNPQPLSTRSSGSGPRRGEKHPPQNHDRLHASAKPFPKS